MKFVYYVLNISELISICVVLDIVSINVLLFNFILKSLAIISKV